jgi:hypothetical protein
MHGTRFELALPEKLRPKRSALDHSAIRAVVICRIKSKFILLEGNGLDQIVQIR